MDWITVRNAEAESRDPVGFGFLWEALQLGYDSDARD